MDMKTEFINFVLCNDHLGDSHNRIDEKGRETDDIECDRKYTHRDLEDFANGDSKDELLAKVYGYISQGDTQKASELLNAPMVKTK